MDADGPDETARAAWRPVQVVESAGRQEPAGGRRARSRPGCGRGRSQRRQSRRVVGPAWGAGGRVEERGGHRSRRRWWRGRREGGQEATRRGPGDGRSGAPGRRRRRLGAGTRSRLVRAPGRGRRRPGGDPEPAGAGDGRGTCLWRCGPMQRGRARGWPRGGRGSRARGRRRMGRAAAGGRGHGGTRRRRSSGVARRWCSCGVGGGRGCPLEQSEAMYG